MASDAAQPKYFTKHLFRTGIVCPTKLFYKAQGYPENKQSVPFIRHAVFNKRLLKSLVRSAYEGKFIEANSIRKSAGQTFGHLQEEQVVLFDAIFEHQQMMARLPVVERNGQDLNIFHIQTKAFDSHNHSLLNNQGRIFSKWRIYLLDFAYQLHIVKQNFPHLTINPFLVLPDKAGCAPTADLPAHLSQFRQEQAEANIPQANQKLLVYLEVGEHISRIWKDLHFARQFLPKSSFEQTVDYLREVYFKKNKIPPQIGFKCKNCEFRLEEERAKEGVKSGFTECWSSHTTADNSSGRHLFDLIGPGTEGWLQQGIYDQRQIPDEDIPSLEEIEAGKGRIKQTLRQALQIHKAKGRKIPSEMIRPNLFKELQRWNYPLHFLDFEAGNYAIPVRSGRRPYHLVVFQFSCHTLHENGQWEHHQWLDDFDNGYANYELIRQLKAVPLINEGTIIQYSNFERNALKIIRRELNQKHDRPSDAAELTGWIEEIIQRRDSTHEDPPFVADLSRQVKHFYYNREMENSLSIKDILHSVMALSPLLEQVYSSPYSSSNFNEMIWWQTNKKGRVHNPYQLLKIYDDEAIGRGTEAMVAYGKLVSNQFSAEEYRLHRDSLLRYCELDTLAMLMIYQHWAYKMEEFTSTEGTS